MAVKLLVVDDHPVVAAGVAALVEGTDIHLVAGAASVEEAVRLVKKHRPDVVLLDVRMPGKDGLEGLQRVKSACSDAAIVMFSAFENRTYVARALAGGAQDFLLKHTSAKEIMSAIRGAAARTQPARAGELRRMAGAMGNRATVRGAEANLTPRESQVLRQIAVGLSNKEIAQALSISIETVKEHVQNLLRKLAVIDRTQAAVWAIRNGAD